MKTVTLSVEDSLYDHLLALISHLPDDKIQIQQVVPTETKPTMSVEEASDYLLKKNAELYERLS